MYELVPEYKCFLFHFLMSPSKELEYVINGEYEGVEYENLVILEVGWDPALSPVSKN